MIEIFFQVKMGPLAPWEVHSCKHGYKGLLPRLVALLMEGPIQLLTPSVVLQHLCLLALIQEHRQLDLLGTAISFTDYANFCSSAFSFGVHSFPDIWRLQIELLIQSLNLMCLLLGRWRRLQSLFQLWLSQMMACQVELVSLSWGKRRWRSTF